MTPSDIATRTLLSLIQRRKLLVERDWFLDVVEEIAYMLEVTERPSWEDIARDLVEILIEHDGVIELFGADDELVPVIAASLRRYHS